MFNTTVVAHGVGSRNEAGPPVKKIVVVGGGKAGWMTALPFVQKSATLLVEALEKGDLGEAVQADFNEAVNGQFEGTRDYIVTHCRTNTRNDTGYWRANAANTNLCEPLHRLLKTRLASWLIIGGIKQGRFGRGYPAMSWHTLLAGMGLFPDPQEMRRSTATPPHDSPPSTT